MTGYRIFSILLALAIGGGGVFGVYWARRSSGTGPDPMVTVQPLSPSGQPEQLSAYASRVDWPTLDALVSAVDVIAVVEWHGDRDETVGLPAADGLLKDSRVDLLRSFESVRVLKGANVPGSFEARTSRANIFQPRASIPLGMTLTYAVQDLAEDTRYVVFLKQLSPEQGGGYGFWGEPGVAELKGNALRWLVTAEYQEDKRKAGQPMGSAGAVAAFDGITIDKIEQAVADGR